MRTGDVSGSVMPDLQRSDLGASSSSTKKSGEKVSDGDNTSDDEEEEERIRNYLSNINEANNITIQNRNNGSIVINYPLADSDGGVTKEVYIRMLRELNRVLRGRPARINIEAGLLLRSKINNILSWFYSSNNTNIFRRSLFYDNSRMTTVLRQLMSVDYNTVYDGVRDDTDTEFVRVVNIQMIVYIL